MHALTQSRGLHALTQSRGFQNASTRHAISFGRLRAKRRARCGGVDRVATTLPRAICDRRRSSSFGGTRQYFCQSLRRVDVEVARLARTALANSRASLRWGASPVYHRAALLVDVVHAFRIFF